MTSSHNHQRQQHSISCSLLPVLLTLLLFTSHLVPTVQSHPFLNKQLSISTVLTTAPPTTASSSSHDGLEDEHVLSLSADVDEVLDAPLMRDIEMLSDMLAEVVKADNPRVYELYTKFRKEGMDRAADPNDSVAFEKMKQMAFEITPHDTYGIMRTFSLALNLVNAAEVRHRLRTLKSPSCSADDTDVAMGRVGPLPRLEDSIGGTFTKILEEMEEKGDGNGDGAREEIWKRLREQSVEIVLTAHPTEVNRKTLLKKYRSISETLGQLDRSDLLPYERHSALQNLKQTVASIWGSDEIRRRKPTPQQEAAGGSAVIEEVLWDAVPSYLRKLDKQCEISLGKGLPLECVPIKFGSWIGGDRDGNPNVTPQVTLEVVTQQRLRAAKLFLRDMDKLYSELAISSRFSPELITYSDNIPQGRNIRERYRRVINYLEKRLVKTIKICEEMLMDAKERQGKDKSFHSIEFQNLNHGSGLGSEDDDIPPISTAADLLVPLQLIHSSLTSTGFSLVADGSLSDTIRRIHVFGLTLVPLDIREESTKHTMALDAVTRHLGVGGYADWDEEARLNWLQTELANKRPLFRTRDVGKMGFDDDVVKTLRTFHAASTLGVESLGAYVISQAQTASDVLAVLLLQKQFGMTAERGTSLRVVPLFETLNDLTNAADVLDTLFKIPAYAGSIRGRQEVMVGYSDSAKDAGRLAALWAQYTAQERMTAVAADHKIQLTFFHGKGGTVGRGGNPALYRAILSHPPDTINGRFRVTEQGEMITQNFGSKEIAERTLDIYTSAVLREAFISHVTPSPEWRDQMARVSQTSCAQYRQLVRETPRFVPYFRQATPELELGSLNIGSRPAKRNPKGGIESLRAIPWTFAWTQTRMNLSAWLGVSAGLTSGTESDQQQLKEMYTQWPWFRENIDLIAMILSKTDFSITENYDNLLVEKDLKALGDAIREDLVKTRKAVLEVSQSTDFAGPHVQFLRASTKIRNPYVDSINCVQAELLRELRNMPADGTEGVSDEVWDIKDVRKDALIVSINGIAQGMRNSG